MADPSRPGSKKFDQNSITKNLHIDGTNNGSITLFLLCVKTMPKRDKTKYVKIFTRSLPEIK